MAGLLPRNAVLLPIDLQRAIGHPSWGRRNNPELEANVTRLYAARRASGRPIVEATARMAGNQGFTAYVVSDATATVDKRLLDGRIVAAEDVHALSLANLSSKYATILSTDEILDRL